MPNPLLSPVGALVALGAIVALSVLLYEVATLRRQYRAALADTLSLRVRVRRLESSCGISHPEDEAVSKAAREHESVPLAVSLCLGVLGAMAPVMLETIPKPWGALCAACAGSIAFVLASHFDSPMLGRVSKAGKGQS